MADQYEVRNCRFKNPDNISEVTVGALKSSDLLFGAGGNKDLEASIYAKYLPIGAGLFQHDYTYDHKRTQDNYEPLRGLGLSLCTKKWQNITIAVDAFGYENINRFF